MAEGCSPHPSLIIIAPGMFSRVNNLSSSLWIAIRRNWWIYVMLIPPFLLLFVFTLIPILQSFLLSFQKWSFRGSSWTGLANYTRLFADPVFFRSMRNTLIYTVFVVPASILIALIL